MSSHRNSGDTNRTDVSGQSFRGGTPSSATSISGSFRSFGSTGSPLFQHLWKPRKSLRTPDAETSLESEPQQLGIKQSKGLDFAAFSAKAEFAAVAAGCKLKVFSWDRSPNFCWNRCWTETVLRDCMATSSRMVGIALSNSLVAVAASSGFEIYELHTAGDARLNMSSTVQVKEPVIPLKEVNGIRTIALSPETSERSGRICVGTEDGRLRIWDIQAISDGEGRYILRRQPPGNLVLRGDPDNAAPEIPSAAAFNQDGSLICVGSKGRHIYIFQWGEDGWSLVNETQLEGNFGCGVLQSIRFTTVAFVSENLIAFTAVSGFPAGCPAVLDMQRKTRTALGDDALDAQSLAVSPSGRRLAFVDEDKHKVILVESSPRGRFDGGVAGQTHITTLKHGSKFFIAALTFTSLASEDDGDSDGLERLLVLDRTGRVQLFSCNT